MKLWICEKPSVARVVAEGLGGGSRKNGYIEISKKIDGEENIVTWCIGHVLSTLEPDEYDEKYKKWVFNDLPIIPEEWKLKANPNTKDQLKILKELIKKADSFVNVGDADREGQLLVDELLMHCKVYNKPATRCFISDMNLNKVKQSIQESYKKDNKTYRPLYEAGLGRQKADWLVGMNYSRGATLMAQKAGFNGVVTIGRVQTPTLAIIVNRDLEIENFKPVDYFNIQALFEKDGKTFKGNWLPKGCTFENIEKVNAVNKREEATDEDLEESLDNSDNEENSNTERPSWLDSSYHLIDENVAKQIVKKIEDAKTGKVIKYKKESKIEKKPKLYNLSGLQSAMSKFGFDAGKTLEVTQKLYENGYLTYPRSDSPYLPISLKGDVVGTLKNLSKIDKFDGYETNPNAKTDVWNDKETTEHHAIIPTAKEPMLGAFSEDEYNLYLVVATAYFANFMEDCLADTASIQVNIADEIFSINGKVITQIGWKAVYNQDKKSSNEDDKELPYLQEGSVVDLNKVEYVATKTQPPSLFDQAKLPMVMGEIYKLITDNPEVRKKLKELKGIGTEATRYKVIEDLKRRKYVKEVKKGKVIYLTSTELGREVVGALPIELTSFIMTAQWEGFLEDVNKGKKQLSDFEIKQKTAIGKMMELFTKTDFSKLAKLEPNTKAGQKFVSSNKPKAPVEKTGDKCPKCGSDLVLRTVMKAGQNHGKKFTGCSAYPKCDYTKWD